MLPHHARELCASGLSPDTILDNGIYSETEPTAVAGLLNWDARRARELGSVLVYPHTDPTGRQLGHATVKPDKPRGRKGKPGVIKYENPFRRPNRLYVPAGALTALPNPVTPLLITEGCKKALAATQHGFPCVSLPGVWSWVAPRPEVAGKKVGRKELFDDLKAISWRDRPAVIVFDSDAAENPAVKRAERELAAALRREGAVVQIIRLPVEPDGTKNGLDDFLVRHGPAALESLINPPGIGATAAAPPSGPAGLTESGYTAIRGGTYHCVLTRDEGTGASVVTRQTKLANFVARIEGHRVTDDGAEQVRELVIGAEQQGKPKVTTGVSVERFAGLDWVVERLGPQFVIQPGSGKRDHLRCAIQELSGDAIPLTTAYTHTGWREVGGDWHYLHAGGAVSGRVPGRGAVEVRLDGSAAGFRLPEPPTGAGLRDAVRGSLRLLAGLAPDAVMFAVLASVYRSVLGTPDYALWLTGPTGVQKSEIAALAQQHFGPAMTRNRLPGNWSSTDNALEGLAFTVKDALLVVDDFAPSAVRADADRQQRAAERIIRGQGNHSGRQRMRADGTLRPTKPPRCLALATGEDVPRTHSITARLCVVRVQKNDVILSRLTESQRDASNGLYAAALAGFAAWLAPRYAAVLRGLDGERIELRDRIVGRCPHARTPDIVANLLLGLKYLLQYAEGVQAIDAVERDRLWQRGQTAFRSLVEAQGEHLEANDPVARFPEMLAAILTSGRGYVADTNGQAPDAPPSPAVWGWESRGIRGGLGEEPFYVPRGPKVGWVRDNELYLEPDSLYAALTEFAREQGQAYPITKQTLTHRLNESGALVRVDKGRTVYPVTIEGSRRRVLVLRADSLFAPGQWGQTGREPLTNGDSFPMPCPGSSIPTSDSGREVGPLPDEMPRPVPSVPNVPISGLEQSSRVVSQESESFFLEAIDAIRH
ncbi:DUF3854 domain-containing protein [Limnoglobus roseus]|uniref:DUF3854 domain-containing protein n=1 Tax=Limnoglobus roseus TaxID=2598579 RepID=UPI00143DE7C6|nr:DUF3854 domain-containing protein [Limnoglobus roseus]